MLFTLCFFISLFVCYSLFPRKKWMSLSGHVPARARSDYRRRLYDQDCRDWWREDQTADLGHCRPGAVRASLVIILIFWTMHAWQLCSQCCPLKTCSIGFAASPSPTIGPHTPLSLSMTFQTRFFLKSSVPLKISIITTKTKCPLTFYALPFKLSHSRPLTAALTGCEKSRSTRPPRFVMINPVSRFYSRWNQSNHGYCPKHLLLNSLALGVSVTPPTRSTVHRHILSTAPPLYEV